MIGRFGRVSALTGVLAVVLWVVGFVLSQGISNPPADNATNAQVLAWIQDKSNVITIGSWLFMLGCGCFVWFAGTLRERLAAAGSGSAAASATIGFAAAVATAVFGMGLPAGDMALAISSKDVSASTAGALHQSGTIFFLIGEISLVAALVGLAVAALQARALPRWWSVVGILLAVVLVIGPIGWLGVIFGLPLWTLLTSGLLLRGSRAAMPLVAASAA